MMDMSTMMSLAGAAVKIGGAIGGGIAARKAARRSMRRVNAQLDGQEARATREFEDQYYADGTQTADNQYALTQMQQYLKQQRQNRAGANAVTGGSNEAVAAQKAIDNQTLASTIGQVAANATSRKDQIRDSYNQTLTNISNARIGNIQDYNNQRQQQIGNAMQSINSAADSLAKSGEGMKETSVKSFFGKG